MKKLFTIFGILFISMISTGCFKRDSLEDITIYTTTYPIEYITNYLYGEHSTIYSIYPNGTDIKKYSLTSKQIEDYSKMDMYIFSGLTDEKDYVTPLFKHNKNLMIIDASQSMSYTYNANELWLDPSNFLMLSLNIKNGLNEYITNHYLKKEIVTNYENLKLEISNIDAKFSLMSESTDNPTIVVDSNTFKFLEKYGFNIISLDETTVTEKNISDVTNMIKNNQISYIFTTNINNLSTTVSTIEQNTNVQVVQLHTLSNLTDDERSNKSDYISLMNENINLLKNELY